MHAAGRALSARRAFSQQLVSWEQNAYIQRMNSTLFLVEIQSWDWPLHVGAKGPSVAAGHGLEGDLICVQTVVIGGLLLAPEEHRSKRIELRLLPLSREIIFGDGDGDERGVGRLYKDPVARKDLDFYATLFLPADTLPSLILCLNSIWRSVHMWVDDSGEPGFVTDFGFSADVPIRD